MIDLKSVKGAKLDLPFKLLSNILVNDAVTSVYLNLITRVTLHTDGALDHQQIRNLLGEITVTPRQLMAVTEGRPIVMMDQISWSFPEKAVHNQEIQSKYKWFQRCKN